MFIGHFAVAFAAKRAAPRTSLTALVASAFLPDILWPIFLWLGIERVRIAPGDTAFTPLDFESYPWSHSLVMVVGWAALLAALYRARTRYTTGALWIGLLVFSHWFLDFASHRPDLPLAPWGGPKVGLGLWNSVVATSVIEIAMFVGGLGIYLLTTRAKGWQGHASLWSMLAFVAWLYVGTIRGAPPPNLLALKIVSTAMLVFFAWFVWIDRTRELRVRE